MYPQAVLYLINGKKNVERDKEMSTVDFDLVSIIVPVYNSEKTIAASIHSLMEQSYRNIEIVIINDGSKDATEDVCVQLARKDSRIKYYRISNGGVSNARNTGIGFATGKYIAFMDSDDAMKSDMIERLVSCMDDTVDLVCAGYSIVDSNGHKRFDKVPSQKQSDKAHAYEVIEDLQENLCFNILWNKMFRSSIIKDCCLKMDTSISMGEDLLFVLDYIKAMTKKIVTLHEALYQYRLSENGLQATYKSNMNLRISHFFRINALYQEEQYPVNGLYVEALRIIYILCVENVNNKAELIRVLNSPICDLLENKVFPCGIKYRVFRALIKSRLVFLVRLFMISVLTAKKLIGKQINW